MSSTKKTLITILGPTAIGKTNLAIAVAKDLSTEIISFDSRQFYKEMFIGTAVPSKEELNEVKHHYIQNKSVLDDYNVGLFEKEALITIQKLFKKHQQIVMVGGSGLYIDAILYGLDDFPKVDVNIRKELTQRLKIEGIESLQNELKEIDFLSYQTIAIDNPQRLTRALEICLGTGKPYSSFKTQQKKERNFNSILIGLTGEREKIYYRINQRVDMMIQNGLLKEVEKLYTKRDLNALQTVGYKELFSFLDGEIDFDFAVDEIKKNTRRFAKRQLTWFRKNKNIIWFDLETETKEIIKTIKTKL